MQGPSELGASGNLLETGTAPPISQRITVPTLVIGASTTRWTPRTCGGWPSSCSTGSTSTARRQPPGDFDDQETWFAGLIGFLQGL